MIFNRSLFRNRIFIKNISIFLAIALIIGILFVTHIVFIPRFWGIEFLGPEYQGVHPFMTGAFFENLTGISSYLAQENGGLIIIFLIIGIFYSFLKHRKTLLLFILSMIPYALVYLFFVFWTDRYAYHLNLFIIPIAGMGIYFVYSLLYKLVSKVFKKFTFKKETIFAAIFSTAVFLLLFLPFTPHRESCEIGTIEYLEGLDELSAKFKRDDLIVTGRSDFASILNYLTDSCVIYVAFTSDGIIVKEYEKAEWENLKSFMVDNKNMTYFVMPKEEVIGGDYVYYEGMYGKLSTIFDLEYEFDNKIASIHRIIPR